MNRVAVAATVATLLAACGADPLELAVDVRTDLRPRDTFFAVRTELEGHGTHDFSAFRGARFLDGVRVAEFGDLEQGDLSLRVSLLDASAAPAASRDVRVKLERSVSVTVVIAASCVSVVCPGAGDAPTLTACAGGRCIDPSAPPMCSTDEQCVTACPGALGRCASGECLCPAPCTPSEELCNDADDNCDGTVDDGFDLANDPTHCGSCGNACALQNATAGCVAGACTVSACNARFADCDGAAVNGCELATSTLTNCGGCGVACARDHATATCATGECRIARCDTSWSNRDMVDANGCEGRIR